MQKQEGKGKPPVVLPGDDLDIEIDVSTQQQQALAALHAPVSGAQPRGSIFTSIAALIALLGKNLAPIVSIGTKVVNDVAAMVKDQPVYDRIRGIKIGSFKKQVIFAVLDDGAPVPAPWSTPTPPPPGG